MKKNWEQYKDEVLQDYENQAKKNGRGDREAFLKITAKKYKINETTVWNRICSLRKKRKAEQLKKIKEEKFDLGKFGIFSREEMIKQIDRMEKHNKKVNGKLRGDWINFLNQLRSTITKENGFDVKQAAKIDKILQDYNLMKLSQTKAKEVANNLPSYINDIPELGPKPNISQIIKNEPRRYEIINHELRNNKQELLDVNKALWEMIDPYKLVRFCNKQLELQQKRKSLGGMKLIFKTLSQIFNQKEDTISARYYSTRKNSSIKLTKIDTLENELSRYSGTIIMLEDKISNLEKEKFSIQEHTQAISKEYFLLENENKELQITLNKLKQNPLVKLSLLIESIIESIKERL